MLTYSKRFLKLLILIVWLSTCHGLWPSSQNSDIEDSEESDTIIVARDLKLNRCLLGRRRLYDPSLPVTNCQYPSDNRIVGGKSVDIKDYPYQVSLQDDDGHLCGGSIISDNWILTAGHCVYSIHPNLTIRAGSTHWNREGQIYRIKRIVSHPQYDDDKLKYDVAVIQVKTKFDFKKRGIKKIKLGCFEPKIGDLVTVSGWGAIKEDGEYPISLRALNLKIVGRKYCTQKLNEPIGQWSICAGGEEGKDSCQADSGGPLVDKNGKQVGVVSWGLGCGRKNHPGVYSNLALVRKWITQITGVN